MPPHALAPPQNGFDPGRRCGRIALTDYLDELSPGSVIVIGLLMIVFPDPATSVFGAGLFLFGLAWLAYEWDRP